MDKRVMVTIPESKMSAFLELLKSIDYVNNVEEDVVPENIQQFVLNRIATADTSEFLTIEEAKKRIKRA